MQEILDESFVAERIGSLVDDMAACYEPDDPDGMRAEIEFEKLRAMYAIHEQLREIAEALRRGRKTKWFF